MELWTPEQEQFMMNVDLNRVDEYEQPDDEEMPDIPDVEMPAEMEELAKRLEEDLDIDNDY